MTKGELNTAVAAAKAEVKAEKEEREEGKVKPYQRGCVTGKNPHLRYGAGRPRGGALQACADG